MKAKVLIVDDDNNNLITLAAVLGQNEYDIHRASNGYDACQMAEALSPDLIILDVMMPGIDGFEVCRRIRATPAIESVPIIMLTALNDQQARLDGISAGADDFLSKPCSYGELRARVATVVRLNRFRVIAEQRARYERLFALAPEAILTLNAEGEILTANERAQTLFNPDANPRFIGQSMYSVCPTDAADILRQIVAVAKPNSTPPAPEHIRLNVSGEERVLSVQASAFSERDTCSILLILSDVTADVRAREEAESLSRRLDGLVQARTQQLEVANDLLTSYAVFISHDLRSPLSAIQFNLEIIKSDLPPSLAESVGQYVTNAGMACSMMGDMIRSLLQLAADEKAGFAQPIPLVDPKPIIERLAWKIASFNPRLKPEFTFDPLPLVAARPALIERVFYNLLVNAIKYSAMRHPPKIHIGSVAVEGGVAIFVRDNGVGFASADSGKIFKEFNRLPGTVQIEGLGLGLSLVTHLLRSHRGRIWAEGKPNEGATFYVQFNLPEAEQAPAQS